ncbi:uncharacterized protein LOC143033009 [Oratosquilla oratoria]|uniref:uncharacterized protein LOC143033009 n=1 Tax=Oratosquilla oratoria TaxID=337810 RepID=UPI003F76E57B
MESHRSRVIAVFVIILQVLQVNAAKPVGVPSPPRGYLPPVTTTPPGEPCVITREVYITPKVVTPPYTETRTLLRTLSAATVMVTRTPTVFASTLTVTTTVVASTLTVTSTLVGEPCITTLTTTRTTTVVAPRGNLLPVTTGEPYVTTITTTRPPTVVASTLTVTRTVVPSTLTVTSTLVGEPCVPTKTVTRTTTSNLIKSVGGNLPPVTTTPAGGPCVTTTISYTVVATAIGATVSRALHVIGSQTIDPCKTSHGRCYFLDVQEKCREDSFCFL